MLFSSPIAGLSPSARIMLVASLSTNMVEKTSHRSHRARVAVELAFGSLMNEKERKSMARQMLRAYGTNLKAPEPLDLHFTALSSATKHPDLLCPHWTTWKGCKTSDSPALGTWPAHQLVWLSPDAEEPLLKLDSEKVYVVGGLIDRSVKKNHTLKLANDANIHVMRLPLREYAPVSNVHPILDVVTVVQILASVNSGGSWREALAAHLPKRHMSRRDFELRQPKRLKRDLGEHPIE